MASQKIYFFLIVILLVSVMLVYGQDKSLDKEVIKKDSTESVNKGSNRKDINLSAVSLKKGDYFGETTEWPAMKVKVTVKKGAISAIEILEDTSTPEFSVKVKEEIPKAIIILGEIDVEGISGATLSSNSLKQAVKLAVKQAVKTP